jgi:acyl-[acyl-carrier-protein]-phospholipid O-acyltransferase/long-chain-fatty-acid--[acyl-carrier-protein] ligase
MPERVPFTAESYRRTLFDALLDTRAEHGGDRVAVEDHERAPLTLSRLVLGASVLGRKLAAATQKGEAVGVLLPNVAGFAAVFFALQARGRVVAMLNFTAGAKALRSALETAEIGVVVTSRRFVEQAKLDEVAAALGERARIVWLEDLRKDVSLADKLIGVAEAAFARARHKSLGVEPDDPAVILFTSGSEGAPKGVVLSHANILANVAQVRAHVALSRDDVMLNPLPVFHSFGLTVGTLTPLYVGMRVVLFPSPLRYREVPKLAREVGATMLMGTDTFLMGYVRAADPDDLKTVRLVIAGAERVKDETRAAWAQKGGATIIEGYGATECAPIVSANPFDDNRPGTVGKLMAGIEHRLESVPGIEDGAGRLHVRGPNVMRGYLMPDAPGVLQPPADGWHDTGDIVTVSADGFVAIKGRAKRFAKLGGEMVSLAAVESFASGVWPGSTHVVVSLPDPRKGEQLVLVTDREDADRTALIKAAKEEGVPELWAPKAVLVVANVPVLGSGKIDYVATADLARQMRPML